MAASMKCNLCRLREQSLSALEQFYINKIQDSCVYVGYCLFYNKKEPNKYPRIRSVELFGDKQPKLHCVIYHAFRDDHHEGLQVSHLCHNKGCVNIHHLKAESQSANQSRNECNSLRRSQRRKLGECIGVHEPPCFPKFKTPILGSSDTPGYVGSIRILLMTLH